MSGLFFITMEEIWKDIEWYEWKYQVSNNGQIKSLLDNYWRPRELILKQGKDKDGYKKIALCLKWKIKYIKIHRLVWIAFIDNPDNKQHINHKNGIKNDNRVENIEWNTPSENHLHKYHTLWYKISDFNRYRNAIMIGQYTFDNVLIKEWKSIMDASKWLNISYSNISRCARWHWKTAWWFIWKRLS